MGISFFSSCGNRTYKAGEQTKPNPNPYRFKLVKYAYSLDKHYLIVLINYPDATNFEGNKFLVFRDVMIEHLQQRVEIDPHFEPNNRLVARLRPDNYGLFTLGNLFKDVTWIYL